MPGCTVVQEKDYIRDAKPNGYRSYHMILETLENGERDDFIQKLSVSPKDRLDLISVRFGKTKKLTRNQKSYWNKYFKFLDSENKDATLEKERSFSR
jgi:hypothetical protein